MKNDPIVITGAARTPIGSFQGALAPVSAPDLGAAAVALPSRDQPSAPNPLKKW